MARGTSTAKKKQPTVVKEPLTVTEARAALVAAGVPVAAKGRLSADAKAKAEEITGRVFAA